ncbi:hypothetical protein MMC24_000514 [Lignoscripta atroalba]|nr:hypothetical protein [Lignoscripta atroalba]
MSLARAFTKRYKSSAGNAPTRAMSTRNCAGTIDRSQISLPVELLSTTNVLAYDAPDIHKSSASSTNSYSDSDSSPVFSSSSRDTTPDTSSAESSPTSAEPNHLSRYFQGPGRASSTEDPHRRSNASSDGDVPAIPSRALSHTKKSHQAIARKRSMSRMTPPPSIFPSSASTRGSVEIFSIKPEANHPFGAELEQVNELAEEFAAKEVTLWDEEEQFLIENGLHKYGVEDYVMEIEPLFGGAFEDVPFPMSTGWI